MWRRQGVVGSLAVLALLAAASGLLWRDGLCQGTDRAAAGVVPPPAASESDSAFEQSGVTARQRQPPPRPRQPEVPDSLRDSEVDGELQVDADGRLVVSPGLRRFFEYFFVASGEESDAAIRARILAAIDERLTGDAHRDAVDMLDRYLGYRALARQMADAPEHADLAARAQALREIRRRSFGDAVAAALFVDEEAALRFALEQRRINADPGLSDAERTAQLAALEAELPAPMRVARDATTAPLRLAEDERALREAGGSPEEVQALREQAVGVEAAQRLAALDRRRAEWQQRLDAYRAERALLDERALDARQRQQAIDALRAKHFATEELARVQALDRIAATTPP